MRGAVILIMFFILFASASLLIPSPMFPGNFFSGLIAVGESAEFLSAVFNGVFYGGILWSVFLAISNKLGPKK